MKKTKILAILLPLLFMTTTFNIVFAEPSASNIATKTAVVNGFYSLTISPIIPSGTSNEIIPRILIKGKKTFVAGWMRDYTFGTQFWSHDPFAIFGVNGTKNAEVVLTGRISFAYDNDKISFIGGWVAGPFHRNQGGVYYQVIPNTIVVLVPSTTPVPGENPDIGRIWVYAYVSSITIGKDAQHTSNQMIFTLTAAYNF